MTEKKSSNNRRKLLKSLAAGSGAVIAGKSLPENWTRPVVDSVMLPAHAQTSGTRTFFTQAIVLMDDQLLDTTPEELIAQSEQGPLSWLVKPAEAQAAPSTVICLTVDGSAYQVELQRGSYSYTGSGTVSHPVSPLNSSCPMPPALSFGVDDIVGSVANVRLLEGKSETPVALPETACNYIFGCD